MRKFILGEKCCHIGLIIFLNSLISDFEIILKNNLFDLFSQDSSVNAGI
jgi:hypothetical protein